MREEKREETRMRREETRREKMETRRKRLECDKIIREKKQKRG